MSEQGDQTREQPPLPPRATVDRFEEDLAVLNVEGQELVVERCRLPDDAREGDVIDFVEGRVDVEATRAAREQLAALRAGLPIKRGSFEL